MIYGPTGSGKTVTMIHVLSTFEKEVDITESWLEVDKTTELINARIVSLGRYGKTREMMSSLPDRVVNGLV